MVVSDISGQVYLLGSSISLTESHIKMRLAMVQTTFN